MSYNPVAEIKATPDQLRGQAAAERALAAVIGLDPASVKLGSMEAMALADDTVRVRWTGIASVSRSDFLAAVPDAPIV